ncbi:hypothetical protein A6B34_13345 [Mycolicibacterium monacense]|nr:hypothetical protein A6B34_13345 [Mycolicibacterium monacense]
MREFIDPFLGNDADYLNIGNARAVLTFLRANYDGLITGSDEIWNMRYKGADQVYLLTPDIRMYHAAYATSANRLNFTNLDIDGKRRMGEALLAYDRIYVRDGNTANVVDTLTGSCIRQSRIIDPTITYEFAELRRDVPARGGNSPRKKRILVMASSHFVVDQLLNKFGHEAEIHSIFIGHRGTTFIDADPVQFLNMFKDYDVIVSQFFHGVCMSIKSGRPFVGFDLAADYPNVESKIKSILTLLDLSSNYHRLTDKDAISIVNHVSEALDGGRNIPASVKLRVDAERTQAWDAAKQIVDDLHARLAAHSL